MAVITGDFDPVNMIRGLITRRDDNYAYVWISRYPIKEIKFPRWANNYRRFLQPGEMVHIKAPTNTDLVQEPENLVQEETNNAVLRPPTQLNGFLMLAYLSFPPENGGYFDAELATTKVYGCRDIAYTFGHGKVALFSDCEKIHYEPMAIYEGYITRIPVEKDWLAERLGTLFIISGYKPLKEVDESKSLLKNAIRQRMPWKGRYTLTQNHNAQTFDMQEEKHQHGLADGIWSEESADDDNTDELHPGIAVEQTNNEHQSIMANRPSAGLVAAMDVEGHQRTMMGHFLDDFRPSAGITEKEKEEGHRSTTINNTSVIAGGGQPIINRHNHQQQSSPIPKNPSPHNDSIFQIISKENQVFATFVASKVQWVQERNNSAAIFLQKAILDQCYQYELKMAGKDKSKPSTSTQNDF